MHTRIRNLLPVLALAAGLVMAMGCSSDDDNPTGPPAPRELDSGNILNGQRYVHTFANAGTYGYHCSIHTNMTSSIGRSIAIESMPGGAGGTPISPEGRASSFPFGSEMTRSTL